MWSHKEERSMVYKKPNKTMHKTKSAHQNFHILARHKGFGGNFGVVLPVRARTLLVIVGVRHRPRILRTLGKV